MKFISLSLGEQNKCVKLCRIERYLFCLHKNVKPPHFHNVTEEEVFDSQSFLGLENAELIDHCSFYTKAENFGFVLYYIKASFDKVKKASNL